MKFLSAVALAMFSVAAPVASPAQSLDPSLLSALCSDDYYEDTSGQCNAIGEVLTVEAILEKCGFIVARETDEGVVVLYFDETEDMPVGSIQPPTASPSAEDATVTDDKSNAEPANEQEIASRVVTPEPQSEIVGEAADDVTTTGPTARRVPAAAEHVDDNRTIE